MQLDQVKNDQRKILVVDDDEVSIAILSRRLKKLGYETDYVSSGEEAIAVFDIKKYSMILLDWMMPNVNGIEVLQHFRETYTQMELPIIMITSNDEAEGITESFLHGGNDYITKPINLSVAIARITTHLQLVHAYNAGLDKEKQGAIDSMVLTYNHEINNPLMVAIGNLKLYEKTQNKKCLEKVERGLERIKSIVKKIEQFKHNHPELEDYTDRSKIYKVD